MNNYCTNCGARLENGATECQNCGCKIVDYRIPENQKTESNDKHEEIEKKYIFYIISLFVASRLLGHIELFEKISFISSIFSLSSIVILVYARVTMPDSKKIKILFNIFISFFILFMIYILIIAITCGRIARSC